MTAFRDAVSRDKAYHVVSVEKTEPPAGIDSGTWYRYTIALEEETIVGNRRGTHTQVMQYASECAENLSSRVARGTSSWSARKKK